MRVLVYMTLYDTGEDFENLPYAAHTTDINRSFADRHGYDFRVFDYPEVGFPDRHPAWTRVHYARENFSDYDYLLYIDGDAFVFDPTIDLEGIVNKYFFNSEALFLSARDQKLMNSVFHGGRPNAGVFLIKCADETEYLLDAWWNVPDDSYYSGEVIQDSNRYLDHRDTLSVHPYEQLALWFLRDRHPKFFKFTESYRELNGLDGRFIRHLMQVPDDVRMRILNEFVKERYNVN